MNETQLADLNDIQDFFNRVDSARNSVSPIEEPHSDPIDVKDFIALCNLCEAQSKYSSGDHDAKTLGNAVDSLDQLDNSELATMEAALRGGVWGDWCETKWRQAKQAKRLKPTINIMKQHPEDAVFYLELKRRTDNQHHYHFSFDRDAVAEIDAFEPFTDGTHDNLNQQWHVLISVLAFYDIAHALSNDQHEYRCLYQYIKKWDKGSLSVLYLKLFCPPNQLENKRIKLQIVIPGTTTTNAETKTPPSEKMNEWLEEALRRLAGK